mmetsp:Transcript_13974/g.28609  ORF Transcript_13974/g.28609 Transcript_13974/m.28609 type:complete len:80 (-) Transcript_13974:218-457(-)
MVDTCAPVGTSHGTETETDAMMISDKGTKAPRHQGDNNEMWRGEGETIRTADGPLMDRERSYKRILSRVNGGVLVARIE